MRDGLPNGEQFTGWPQERTPKEWRRVKLSEACDLQVGYAFRSEWFSDYDGVRLLRGENVGYGNPDWSDTKRLPDNYSRRFPEYLLRGGDVVIGMDRTFTKSGVKVSVLDPDDAPALLVQRVGRFEPRGAIRGFILQLLGWHAFHRELLAQQKGMDIPHLSKAEILSPLVPLPNEEEQRCIAEILDTLDETIRKTEQLIAKLNQVKQGLLRDLLTRGIDDNGELRDPESHPEQFKGSPLGRISSTWSTTPLGHLLETIEQGWSPDCPSQRTPAGEWGVLKTSAVVWDGYQDDQNKVLPSGLTPRPEYEVRLGDVLMTRAGPNSRVGVVALVTRTQGRLMISDKLYRLVPGRLLAPAFLVLGLSGSLTQRHLSTLKTGLAESQTNISQGIACALLFAVPPLPEQHAIVSLVNAAEARVTHESCQLTKLKLLKQGLMEDLLTGHVRVTNLLKGAAT